MSQSNFEIQMHFFKYCFSFKLSNWILAFASKLFSKIISISGPGYFFKQLLYRFEQEILDWEKCCKLLLFFLFTHTTPIDKMEIEEMCGFSFHKKLCFLKFWLEICPYVLLADSLFSTFRALTPQRLKDSLQMLLEQAVLSSCYVLKSTRK